MFSRETLEAFQREFLPRDVAVAVVDAMIRHRQETHRPAPTQDEFKLVLSEVMRLYFGATMVDLVKLGHATVDLNPDGTVKWILTKEGHRVAEEEHAERQNSPTP